MRIALVHDSLSQMGGAERVVFCLHKLFPDAPVYTSYYDSAAMPDAFRTWDIRPSFLQHLYALAGSSRGFLPLYPPAFESLKIGPCDLVLTSSALFAQGVRVPVGVPHVVYCHTPIRLVWETDQHLQSARASWVRRALTGIIRMPLRRWDERASRRVTAYIANSKNTQAKIQKFYGRDATVIYPPIDASRFSIAPAVDDYFLIVSRLVHSKNIPLAIEAFNRMRLPLKIAGAGPEDRALRAQAGPTIEFLGYRSDQEVTVLMGRCRALILPGEEDLGLTPLEANAAGRPVIALGAGGVVETVVPGQTGTLFGEPNPASLMDAIHRCSQTSFNPGVLRAHAVRFDLPVFKEKMTDFLRPFEGRA